MTQIERIYADLSIFSRLLRQATFKNPL